MPVHQKQLRRWEQQRSDGRGTHGEEINTHKTLAGKIVGKVHLKDPDINESRI